LIVYLAFLLLPGLMLPLAPTLRSVDAWEGVALTYVELHYSFTLGPGDRIALSRGVFDGASPYYGLLLPVLLGAWEKARGLLDLGAHVRLVQLANLAFVTLALAGYWSWARHRRAAFAIPALMLLPWVHSSHIAIFHPNQTGWRFLGLSIVVLTLVLLRRRPAPKAVSPLAAVLALAALINIETAIAAGAGVGMYMICRADGDYRRMTVLALRFALTGVAAAAILLSCLSLLVPGAINVQHFLSSQLYMLETFSGGYGGLKAGIDPFAVLMFGHATYIVIRALLTRSIAPLSGASSTRAAIAMIIVVWGAYYINRPDPWNLWSYFYLYGFIVAPYFDPRVWRVLAGRIRALPVAASAFGLIILPLIASTNADAVMSVAYAMATAPEHESLAAVSGIRVPANTAAKFASKAAFLRTFDGHSMAYVSTDSYLMSLMSGLDNRLPFLDVFGEALTPARFSILRDAIDQSAPAFLLFDDSALVSPLTEEREHLFARLKRELQDRYQFVETQAGWEVWKRRSLATL
jgi:hypothetical protein